MFFDYPKTRVYPGMPQLRPEQKIIPSVFHYLWNYCSRKGAVSGVSEWTSYRVRQIAGVFIGLAVVPAGHSLATEINDTNFPQIKVDLSDFRISPNSKIRVKIFPHDRDYKPHGQDRNRTQIQISALEPCQVFEGKATYPGKTNRILYESRLIPISVTSLPSPLWVDCKKPATLLREHGLPHFTYAGSFYIRKVPHGEGHRLEVINVVRLRDYLKGVVPSEVYPEWPMETLKTQAVAARTYAVFHYAYSRRYAKSRFWDVDDTIAFQAYTGTSLRTERTDLAVQATAGQILTHAGEVIQAYYHADSGGRTEAASNVWSTEIPYVGPLQELFYEEQQSTSWSRKIDLNELAAKLREFEVLSQGKEKITNLAVPVIGRTESGRVRIVTVTLDGKKYLNINVKWLRRAIGQLPSTLFSFERDHDDQGTIWLRGKGNGHGVGMSQQGAAFLASTQGWTYDRILNFYYLDTTLCHLGMKQDQLPDCYELAKSLNSEKIAIEDKPKRS